MFRALGPRILMFRDFKYSGFGGLGFRDLGVWWADGCGFGACRVQCLAGHNLIRAMAQ